MPSSLANSASTPWAPDVSLRLHSAPQPCRPAIYVEAYDPATHSACHLSTWLFNYSEDEMEFNAERVSFEQGMRVTVISINNHRIEGVVKAVQQYSLSSQKVRLEIDNTRNHRPPVAQIFSE